MMLLSNKNVLITGSTGDIGGAICEVFLQNGASLFLTGTKQSALEKLNIKLLSKFNDAKIDYLPCDLSNIEGIPDFIKTTEKMIGNIDILICNAGIVDDSLAVRMSNKQWQNVINTNLTANFVLARECIKGMIKQKFGRIINISSICGLTGNVGQANYSASKAGLIAMTKCLAREYALRGITANCIAPGFINTKMSMKIRKDIKEQVVDGIPMKCFQIWLII